MRKRALRLAPGEAERAQQAAERSAQELHSSHGGSSLIRGTLETAPVSTETSLVANVAVLLGTLF